MDKMWCNSLWRNLLWFICPVCYSIWNHRKKFKILFRNWGLYIRIVTSINSFVQLLEFQFVKSVFFKPHLNLYQRFWKLHVCIRLIMSFSYSKNCYKKRSTIPFLSQNLLYVITLMPRTLAKLKKYGQWWISRLTFNLLI